MSVRQPASASAPSGQTAPVQQTGRAASVASSAVVQTPVPPLADVSLAPFVRFVPSVTETPPPPLPPLPPFGRLPVSLQNLSRTVRRTLAQLLHIDAELYGQRLLLAVSGGADSLALLTLCALWRQKTDFACFVGHINHNLRPESAAEARYVAAVCAHCGMPCFTASLDVRACAAHRGMGVEEAARVLRYAALEHLRRHCDAAWLCTAHHAADVQEDMLLRLLRGTGWPALGGMTACDPARHLCRPLLEIPPAALRDLLRALGIAWLEDASNADTRYTRNRVRHELLPLLRSYNARIGRHLEQLWHMAQDDAVHWDAVLDDLLIRHGLPTDAPLAELPAALLRNCDKATRMRVYLRAVRSWQTVGGADDTAPHGQAQYAALSRLDAAYCENCSGRGALTFELSGNMVLRLHNGGVRVQRKDKE